MGLLFTDSDLLYRGVLYRQWFVTMSCPFKTHLTVFCSDITLPYHSVLHQHYYC
jgi:hypothetical protein